MCRTSLEATAAATVCRDGSDDGVTWCCMTKNDMVYTLGPSDVDGEDVYRVMMISVCEEDDDGVICWMMGPWVYMMGMMLWVVDGVRMMMLIMYDMGDNGVGLGGDYRLVKYGS